MIGSKHAAAAILLLDIHAVEAGAGGKVLPSTYHGALAEHLTAIVAECYEGGLSDGALELQELARVMHWDMTAWYMIARVPGVKWPPPLNVRPELGYDPLVFDQLRVVLGVLAGEARQAEPKTETKDLPPTRHSPDFRSVHWLGTDYVFTVNQARCVAVLWQAWESGSAEVSGAHVLEEAEIQDSANRFDRVFRGNQAWGTMIVSGRTKGTYRLAPPK